MYTIAFNTPYSLQISSSSVSIEGNLLGYDTSQSKCQHTAFLVGHSFSWVVAEVKIDSAFATTISSALSGHTELAMYNCFTLASPTGCD